MKKYLGLLVVLAFVVNINVGKAEDDASMKISDDLRTRVELQGNLQDKRMEIKTAMRLEAKQRMQNLREKIKEEKDASKARIKELRIVGREKALERFDMAIEKMTNLKNRVNDHMAKFEAKGVNVAEVKSFVATAEAKLGEAGVKIAEANALLSVSIDQLTAQNKITLRTLAKEIQDLIKETHRALNDAIKALKDTVKIKMEATRTSVEAGATTSAQ